MTQDSPTTSSRLVKAIAQALKDPLVIPLQAGEVIYALPADDSPEFDAPPLTITYGRSPSLSVKRTYSVLYDKVRRVRKADRASGGEYSSLAGGALAGSLTACSVGWKKEPWDRKPIPSLSTGYRLILTIRDEPVGYCSFGINMIQYPVDPLDFEVEVFEIFIEPKYRGRHLSRHFASVVVQFTVNALYEICDRLDKMGIEDSCGLWLRIAAEVYSDSGARFLKTVKKAFTSRQEIALSWDAALDLPYYSCTPSEMYSPGILPLYIAGYDVEPRW